MGGGQPYMYDPPKRYSAVDPYDGFNPKAVTMASRQPPPPPKPKSEGPLININRHPDSYLIVPYGNTNAKPMSPRTKANIKWTRWIQLFFRVLQLLEAIGMLICVICIRGTQGTEGWIIRIPPGVDILSGLYAVYHLLRTAKARTPASSASYHFFALMMDSGLIPFYVFMALIANRNYNEKPGTDGRWRTFFPTDEDANKVLNATWLIAVTAGALHCASLFLDLYLVLMFRKIARLPPDMNPLEDNLTSRRKTKHKHKNSSISAITPLTADEKRMSAQSGSTVSLPNRQSQADPLMPSPDASRVSFFHTRTNSDISYSPHNPTTARLSRTDLPNPIYQQPASARASRADLHHREDLHRRNDSDSETLNQRKSFLEAQSIRRSRPNSQAPSQRNSSFVSSLSPDNDNDNDDMNNNPPQKTSRESLQSDNWFVHSTGENNPSVTHPSSTKNQSKARSNTTSRGYNALPLSGDVSDDEKMMPQPLRMNPPTPPPASRPTTATTTATTSTYDNPDPTNHPNLTRTQTVTSISTDATFTRSPKRAGTPKSRYYGDLRAATQGIRNSASNTTLNSPTKPYYTQNRPTSPSKLSPKKPFSSIRRTGETAYTPIERQSPRVVSRSGIDIDGDYESDYAGDLGMGGGRHRDVSGKIAEEGRGGTGGRWGAMGLGGGLTFRKVSGVAYSA